MEAIRKITVSILRAAGVLALCAALLGGWYLLENREVRQEAEFIFAGTKDDADCSILLSGGFCVVIDTGEAQDAGHILELLREKKVDKIDCLLLTHPDKDHIGGASFLLDQIPVTQVLIPYFDGEKPLYEDLLTKLEEKRIPSESLSRDRLFTYGELDIRVFPPEEFHYEESNDYSLAALVKHGDITLFYAGDAEKERLGELLELDLPTVNVYKTAHHGRNSGRGAKLIEKLAPEYAVVTSKEPEREIKEAYEKTETSIFTTITQDIILKSDGKKIEVDIKVK